MKSLKEYRDKVLARHDVKTAYDALEDEFSLAKAMIQARAESGLTQEDLAERMGTTQSTVARWESGKALPSCRTLMRLAEATGTRFRAQFVKR